MMRLAQNWFVAAASFALVACASAPPATTSDVTGGPAGRIAAAVPLMHLTAKASTPSVSAPRRTQRCVVSSPTTGGASRCRFAKVFNSEVTSLFKDYLSTVSDGEKKAEENSEEASQVFTDVKLAGVQIVDHWVSGDGTEYAVAYLNMDAFGAATIPIRSRSCPSAAAAQRERARLRKAAVGCAPQE